MEDERDVSLWLQHFNELQDMLSWVIHEMQDCDDKKHLMDLFLKLLDKFQEPVIEKADVTEESENKIVL